MSGLFPQLYTAKKDDSILLVVPLLKSSLPMMIGFRGMASTRR
jgi:hypothetical protein